MNLQTLTLIFQILFFFGLSACRGNDSVITSTQDAYMTNSCHNRSLRTKRIPAGVARIGSDGGYPEEAPVKTVEINSFEIDETEVTNAQFAKFVDEAGYVTSAEKIQPGFEVSGAAVFTPPNATNPTWWRYVEGANWRHPDGPESAIAGRGQDPVVQVSHEYAKAYAAWAGRTLPTEAQWEYAARGGSETRYVWGDSRTINGQEQANTWQGAFPIQNTEDDGFLRRAPVGCYSPNAFGLYDMIGNVLEWTDTVYQQSESEPVTS